jgi:predicted DCC family thiol-disulfide oxidoreductase YuxK
MRPVLIYDGDCGFCTASVRWARSRIRHLPAAQPFQSADLAALGLSRAVCDQAVQFVDGDGSVHAGSRAIARVLIASRGPWAVLGRLMSVPVVRGVSAVAYRVIARHRHRLPGSTQACDTGR